MERLWFLVGVALHGGGPHAAQTVCVTVRTVTWTKTV